MTRKPHEDIPMAKYIERRVLELTANERAWLRFLREVSNDRDPTPTLRRVQLLRRFCAPRRT